MIHGLQVPKHKASHHESFVTSVCSLTPIPQTVGEEALKRQQNLDSLFLIRASFHRALRRPGVMFSRRSTHPVSVLDECRAALHSKKRPLEDMTFAGVFSEKILVERVRRRQSDGRYELVAGKLLKIVTQKELPAIFYDDVRGLFDPDGTLWHHSAFLKKIAGIAAKDKLPDCFDGTVLEHRRKLLPRPPSESSSKTLLLLPLPHLVPFLAKERPLRATCRELRGTMPWNPKSCPPRELLRAWERLGPGEADVHNVAASAIARLHDVLFRELRLRRHLDKRDLARAAKYVASQLDLKTSRGVGRDLVQSFGAIKGWILAFDESGAFIMAQDSYDGWSRSELREASESLRCVGVPAEVLGPLKYARRSDASSLMGANPSYIFAHGYCLRRGEIWALRVCKPLGGW